MILYDLGSMSGYLYYVLNESDVRCGWPGYVEIALE